MIKSKIPPLLTNHVFRYSLSWSLILSGLAFSFISVYFSYSRSKEFFSEVIIVLGLFSNPDFEVNKTTKAIYRLLRFIGSIILLGIDLQLIKNSVLKNGNTFVYVIALFMTIIILTYYIYLTYSIISTAFNKIKSNTNNISKFFKYAGVVIGFFISVATLINIIVGIVSSKK